MTMKNLIVLIVFTLLLTATARANPGDDGKIKISDLTVRGQIEGKSITFALAFTAETNRHGVEIPLFDGDAVLIDVVQPASGYRLRYDRDSRTYFMSFPKEGMYGVEIIFAARPTVLDDGEWRQAKFDIPTSQVRRLEVTCDRTDLEVRFPNAMRLEREMREGKLVITAILGPTEPFAVRWKPQVQALDGKLVMSSEANTMVRVSSGAMSVDSLFLFEIAQGKLEELIFRVPEALSITQVRGEHIRDWSIADGPRGRTLTVSLNRPQRSQYGLQILSETVLASFPLTVALPVIEPVGGLRAGGCLAVGTDSAIQLMVEKTGGLSQIDATAFPRVVLDREHARTLPRGKNFFYTFAATPYRMQLKLADIVPGYDAAHRLLISMQEDDLTIEGDLELDVRDAPIRSLTVAAPGQYVVAAVTGAAVDDYRVMPAPGPDSPQRIEVQFKEPVIGRTVVQLRLELGRGPLDELQKIDALNVEGAKSQRGYLLVAAEGGVLIENPAAAGLREVHTGSVPMRVANAQFGYRFREANWSLELLGHKKPAGVRVENFHLESFGEGIVYSSVAVNYFITGSPIDELHFFIPSDAQNVEFVGRDVRRWTRQADHWTVKLQRKVIGDYNLGVIYNQRYTDGGRIRIGAVQCEQVETQTGYIVAASHLNLRLTEPEEPANELLSIGRDEVPANYRLLANAPILKTYKYVSSPHSMPLTVSTYERGQLLSAVVDIMQATSRLAVRDDGDAESVTTIRYKIKNTSSQFLELAMPPGAKVWSTRLIERDANGNEQATRVTASFDKKRDVLMIPLKRQLNPNEPSTVELEYGQVHDELGWWRGHLELDAPRSEVPATYAGWRVVVPEQWSVRPAAGNMIPEDRAAQTHDAAFVLSSVGGAWARAGEWLTRLSALQLGAAIAVLGGLLALIGALARAYLPDALVAVVLAALVTLGGVAANTAPVEQTLASSADLTAVSFTQAVDLDPSIPLAVGVDVVPSWRQDLTIWGAVVSPIVVLVAVGLGLMARRGRALMAGLAVAAAFYSASQFSVCAVPLGHLLTWGVPALLAGWFIWRVVVRRMIFGSPGSAAVAAMLLVGLTISLTGCGGGTGPTPISDQPVIEKIELKLTADRDAMDIDAVLKISAPKPAKLPLMSAEAVLMSTDRPAPNVGLVREDGKHYLDIEQRGVYEINLRFLAPLVKAGEDQVHKFALPLPVSLTNRVQLTVPEGGMEIAAPGAVRLETEEGEKHTAATAIFAPGEAVQFAWRPRARQTALEATQFFVDLIGIARLDAGLVEARHRLNFQIAQGQLAEVRLRVPKNMTVTALHGESLGAWRFDPATHELQAKLSRPAVGEYQLTLITQVANQTMPYEVTLRPITVLDARRQRGMTGVLTSESVHLSLGDHPQSMNVDDFARNAGDLLAKMGGVKASDVRHAFRTHGDEDRIVLAASEVLPELRTDEDAGFKVADDRLVYKGRFILEIAKAGLFSADLRLPAEYDIDALASDAISHWDEVTEGDVRTVTVHFRRKVLGKIAVSLDMSRPVSELPDRIAVPRVEVPGALKHTGKVVISSDRGVRLSIVHRRGVSELNPLELGIREQGTLAFRLLGPQWQLELATEVVEPRVTVSFVHVAKVTDGLVRHTHYMRYRLYHAGAKVFMLSVPEDALSLLISGPDIARREEIEPGRWRVELASKVYDRPYLLQLSYETRFDQATGQISLSSVEAADADLQRGHVVVFATDRVELAELKVDPQLQQSEARSVPRDFGTGDLSGAALCYRSNTGRFDLTLQATRHDAASLLQADVQRAAITSVVTETGETINRVDMHLRVGAKRHLKTILPDGASIWSLEVNGRATAPSRTTEGGRSVVLIPLMQAASGEISVNLSLVYVLSRQAAWSGRQIFHGPRFDLPLKQIQWTFFVPERFEYNDFKGTLTVNEQYLRNTSVRRYDIDRYETELFRFNREEQLRAQKLQKQAKELAQAGRQYEARQALELGKNYSRNDVALNEDIRVDLQNLLKQQAKVGLVGSRSRLRRQMDEHDAQPTAQSTAVEVGDQFSLQQAERIESSLSKSDSENLEMITRRMIEMQEAAAGENVQLAVSMPLRGRLLQFDRPLQVKPASDMTVSFAVDTPMQPVAQSGLWAAGLGAGVLVLLIVVQAVAGRWNDLRSALARPRREEPDDMFDEPLDDEMDDAFGESDSDDPQTADDNR